MITNTSNRYLITICAFLSILASINLFFSLLLGIWRGIYGLKDLLFQKSHISFLIMCLVPHLLLHLEGRKKLCLLFRLYQGLVQHMCKRILLTKLLAIFHSNLEDLICFMTFDSRFLGLKSSARLAISFYCYK